MEKILKNSDKKQFRKKKSQNFGKLEFYFLEKKWKVPIKFLMHWKKSEDCSEILV